MQTINKLKGFFLIEVAVASAVIATVLILLIGAVQNSVEVSARALERTQAAYLLEEGAEAIKSIRNTNWDTVSGLSIGTTYYLSWSGGAWTFSTTPVSIDRFTRTVTCSNVTRDGNDDISGSGSTDTGTKSCTVMVSWSAPSGNQSQSLVLYVSDIN